MNLRPDRVEAAFSQAVKQPSLEAREAFLQEFCGEDEALLGRLRELLLAYDGADEFLEKPPVVDRTASPEDLTVAAEFARLKPEQAGERIGPYKLLEQIGEGGFGVVWVAEQEKPVRRRVALKIIKLGMDTKEVIARFEQERQALAMMEHPNIARVLDAGATQFGRPFFVMELVRGIKITDYCDQAKLPTSERLKLFILVCHAVQHAHQKGIIHRDLKPSNIMVTLHDGVPVPKVIDFGVAKATQQQRLTDLTVYTQFDQMIGTPLYMSPEQAEMSGLDIDTRSDIYSLGVLLYELLAGRTPFDPQELLKAGYDEMRRVIREQEPQKPSTFLSTMAADVRTNVARHRHIEGAKLISSIRGDLDWIVMKALEKDRARRYETANDFASDIQRHLTDEPVLARPASQLYRFQRMVRRNKVAFSAAAAVTVALVVGLTVSVWQAVRAGAAEKRTSAVVEDLRATAPAFAEQARTLAATEQFDEAISKLDYALKLRPGAAEYLLPKADFLQCQLRLAEAAAAYRAVLASQPSNARARTNAVLCEKLLAANDDPQKLSRANLSELFAAMRTEQRSPAELIRVGRLLNEERNLLIPYWMQRLKGLPIPPGSPLEQRLTMREDGLLTLNLSGTKATDLHPLEGMPLGSLDCDQCAGVEDLSPLRGMPLKELYVRETQISDLSPLATLHGLEKLYARNTKITDLAPLHGLPLKELAIAATAISDLSPLRGMPLELLAIEYLPVTDLSPLAGIPLKTLFALGIPAKDFAPLTDLPLETLSLGEAPNLRDLSFIGKMPLRELLLFGCAQASNFAVLSRIPTLALLVVPTEVFNLPDAERVAISDLKTHPNLRQFDWEFPQNMRWNEALAHVRSKDRFWLEWERQAQFLDPLRKAGGKASLTIYPDATWAVRVEDQAGSDIDCLRGAPISWLVLFNRKVTDLSPLEGMPLKFLALQKGKATDLRPLKGLPLTTLLMGDAPPATDVSVLAEIPTLEKIVLPRDPANLEALRNLPNLKYISFDFDGQTQLPSMSAEQFWKNPFTVGELTKQGKFTEAAQALRERIETGRSSDEAADWLRLAAAELLAGDHKGYRATCAEVVKRYEKTTVAREADITARACLLTPDSGIAAADVAALILIESARAVESEAENRQWFFLTCGLRDYRAGRWAEAAEQLNKSGAKRSVVKATISILRAMIYQQQQNRAVALTELQRAREKMLAPRSAANPQDWLAADVILQEAEKLIAGEAPDTGRK